jgi:hypothetical protein
MPTERIVGLLPAIVAMEAVYLQAPHDADEEWDVLCLPVLGWVVHEETPDDPAYPPWTFSQPIIKWPDCEIAAHEVEMSNGFWFLVNVMPAGTPPEWYEFASVAQQAWTARTQAQRVQLGSDGPILTLAPGARIVDE